VSRLRVQKITTKFFVLNYLRISCAGKQGKGYSIQAILLFLSNVLLRIFSIEVFAFFIIG